MPLQCRSAARSAVGDIIIAVCAHWNISESRRAARAVGSCRVYSAKRSIGVLEPARPLYGAQPFHPPYSMVSTWTSPTRIVRGLEGTALGSGPISIYHAAVQPAPNSTSLPLRIARSGKAQGAALQQTRDYPHSTAGRAKQAATQRPE